MTLTGVTAAMLERAAREESLLRERHVPSEARGLARQENRPGLRARLSEACGRNLMLTGADFGALVARLGDVAARDIAWADACREPDDADDFALEIAYVICNSGMKNTVARRIYNAVAAELQAGRSAAGVFGHKGKAAAIDQIWRDRARLMAEYLGAPDKLAYARMLPWVGEITCYHVVKNFGAQVAKPDVHLQRLADAEGVTPQQLCERLAAETGHSVPAIDTVLWRACANGVLNSRTGRIV